MRIYASFPNLLLSYPLTGASQPQNRVKATIGKPISLACPLNIQRLLHLSWNRCSAEDQCRKDWDKSRISYITDMKNIYVDYPERYELAANGTLTIKEVKPEDDNKILICRGMTRFGKEENITVLEIIRGMKMQNCSFSWPLTPNPPLTIIEQERRGVHYAPLVPKPPAPRHYNAVW